MNAARLIVLLAAFAIVVSLIDRRTRPSALGLMLVGVIGIGVSFAIYQLQERGTPQAISQVNVVSVPPGPTIYPVIAFGWLPLLVLLILVGFAVIKQPRRHLATVAAWIFFGLASLVALGLLAPPRHFLSSVQPTQFATPSSSNNQRTMALADHTIPAPPPAPALAANTETKPKAQSESANDAKSAPDQPSKHATADWTYDQSPKDVYSVNVDSGTYSDPAARDQMLDIKMAAAANRYIDEVLYHQSGVADAVALEPEFVRYFVRGQTASPRTTKPRCGWNSISVSATRSIAATGNSLLYRESNNWAEFRWPLLRCWPLRYGLLLWTNRSRQPVASSASRPPIRFDLRRFILGTVGGSVGASIALFVARSEQQNFGAGGAAVLALIGAALGATIFGLLFTAFVRPPRPNRN